MKYFSRINFVKKNFHSCFGPFATLVASLHKRTIRPRYNESINFVDNENCNLVANASVYPFRML